MNDQPMSANDPQPPATLPGEAPPPVPRAGGSLTRAANGLVIWIARHWLAVFNTAWALYVLLPFLAPVLVQAGLTIPAQVIYTIYSVLRHQLPTHSYFLFGPNPVPQAPELIAAGMSAGNNLFAERGFIGDPHVGWKVALCQRDIAIYATVFLTGLLYSRLRYRLRPLPFKYYVLFMLPIAVDGLTGVFGWRESNWWLRTLTGALFGFGSVWFAYPYIEEAMEEVLETELIHKAAGG